MALPAFPRRTIHLDFHTGPDIPDVAADFDPERFARTFRDAHVDSVTVFALCHHGHAYHKTRHPCRHPSLPAGLDLTGSQIRALHRAGIRAPIYISAQVNEYAAREHPEWLAVAPDGRIVKNGGPLGAGWHVLDMASPYQEYLAQIIEEVLDLYAPTDGVFLDMCWDQPSVSRWALAGMARAGLDPKSETDRARWAREVALGYMDRFAGMVDRAHRGREHLGIWFNSRPKTNLFREARYLRHVEVESLPTGGWGYAYFPYVARFVRPLGLPTLTHTGRFFKSWGDNASLKPEAALKYECCQVLSQGMALGVGDLLHPRGMPQQAVYDLVGRVYAYAERCEPHTAGAKVVSEIALVVNPELGDNPGPSGLGATRALTQLKHQFDVVAPSTPLSRYALVLVPETTAVEAALAKRLRAYVKSGGALMLFGAAALDRDGKAVIPEQRIVTSGPSPYSHTFLRSGSRVRHGLAVYDYVMYEPGFRMVPAKGAEALVRVVEPYFERDYSRWSGHSYTPPDRLSKYAAVVRAGNVLTISVPLLEAYGRHASPNYRALLGGCIDQLLPRPLLRVGGPSFLETSVMRSASRTIVHLLAFCPERRAEGLDVVEDPVPMVDVPVAVRADRPPRRVTLEPEGRELAWRFVDGYVHLSVSASGGHAMVVLR